MFFLFPELKSILPVLWGPCLSATVYKDRTKRPNKALSKVNIFQASPFQIALQTQQVSGMLKLI